MSEAPEGQTDDFDTEFATARAAEFDGDDGHEEGGEEPAAEAADDGGDEPAPKPEPEADKVTKRLRDTQRALKAERQQRQQLTARLEALEKGATAKDAPATPEALLAALREDDDDPIGDLQAVKKLAKLLVGQTETERAAEQQAAQRQQALATVSSTMKDYEDDFREVTPDYDKAAKHFMDARMEELKDTGLEGPALAIAMQNDFAGIVTRSIAAGKDPAEIIYNMSLRRGFQAQKANAKLDTIQRGQAQARTLPGGGTATGGLSMSKVADLSGAAFDSAFEKLRASERRR